MSQSHISFFLPCNPPKSTAQQQKTTVIPLKGTGKRKFHVRKYDPENVKAAKNDLFAMLYPERPEKPFEGPVKLAVNWIYPWRKSEPKKNRVNGYKHCDTRPDCSNLVKALEDVMTRAHFWNDDSQVACLHFEKMWGDVPGVGITITEL